MAASVGIDREKVLSALTSDDAKKTFAEKGVIVAYLYGSVADGHIHPHSDVDIAVVFGDSVPTSEYTRRRVELITTLMDLLDVDELDVVPLNRAPMLLTHEVLRHPVTVYLSDETAAAEFELKALGLSYDFMRVLDSYIEEMSSRIKERGL